MKKKGFTLIELLAVIIILAIVALVATPIILNVVNDAKSNAALSEAKMIYSGINNYCEEAKYRKQLNGTANICEDGVTIEEVNSMVNLGNAKILELEYDGKVTKLIVESNGNDIELQDENFVILAPDTTMPTIVESSKKGIAFETIDNETQTYFTATFGRKGGNIQCNPINTKDLTVGDYTVKCKAIGNNGKESAEVERTITVYTPDISTALTLDYKATNTAGLLKDDTGYYYKGSVKNNFVWFAGHLWRVISIDNDNNLTMITQQPITSIQPTKAVWTTEQEYKDSYVNTWLNEVFLASMVDDDKSKLLDVTFNIGGLYNSETKLVENIDSIQTTQKVGLLDVNQFLKAGELKSYLIIEDDFWLSNVRSNSSLCYLYDVLYNGARFGGSEVSLAHGVRPVVKISNLTFADGDGTISNPYRLQSSTTGTNNIKVGEYISVPTMGDECGKDKKCLFRVINADSDSIKVALNGLLPTRSATTSVYNNESNPIPKILTTFANKISETYRYPMNKDFNIGMYKAGSNYTDVKNLTYSSTVGLPVVGEMFSGNDIDIANIPHISHTFVNTSTIENPTVGNNFWTMNAKNSSDVLHITISGNLYTPAYHDDSYPSKKYGIRPVLFLKNNLNFTGGEGTAENPFTLE